MTANEWGKTLNEKLAKSSDLWAITRAHKADQSALHATLSTIHAAVGEVDFDYVGVSIKDSSATEYWLYLFTQDLLVTVRRKSTTPEDVSAVVRARADLETLDVASAPRATFPSASTTPSDLSLALTYSGGFTFSLRDRDGELACFLPSLRSDLLR